MRDSLSFQQSCGYRAKTSIISMPWGADNEMPLNIDIYNSHCIRRLQYVNLQCTQHEQRVSNKNMLHYVKFYFAGNTQSGAVIRQNIGRYGLIVLKLCFNSLRPSDAYVRQQTSPPLIQIRACHLIGVKPLSELMLEYR